MAITAFLSPSPGLLNRGPGGPASLGHVPHSSIFSPTDLRLWTPTAQSGVLRPPLLNAGSLYCILSPTDLNFLSPGLYDNLTSTLLPASVTISYSIQPFDSQGHILLIPSTGCTCYLHRCISYFDSSAGVNMQHLIPCLTLSIIRYMSRVNWSKLWEGVAPSLTPRCSSYWKGSLLVTLDYFTFFFVFK